MKAGSVSPFLFLLPALIFCGCKSTDLEEQNMATDRNWFEEGWNQHNPAVIDNYFAADFVSHGLGANNVDEWKQQVNTLLAAFPDVNVTIDDQFAKGDKVVNRVTARATHQGRYMDIPPTGKEVTFTAINIARLDNGKYVEGWSIMDVQSLMQQLQAGTAENTSHLTEIVDQMRQAYNRHDAAAIADLYAEDAVYMLAGEPEPLRGKKAIEENYAAFFTGFSDIEVEFPLVVASGDHVFAEAVARGTHTGPFPTPEGEVATTGRKIDIRVAFVGRVNSEGLIEEDRTYFDSAVLMTQLGLNELSKETSAQ